MKQRIKNLQKLDRQRLDAAVMRIQGRPILLSLFNLILLSINSLGFIKRKLQTIVYRLKISKKAPLQFQALGVTPKNMPAHKFSESLSVLIVCEASIAQCLRYRVVQKVQWLASQGLKASWINWTEYFEVRNQIHFYDIIIFYRVPSYPLSLANIEYAKSLNKTVIYDVDDLIFDRDELESYYKDHGSQLSKKQYKQVLSGAQNYAKAIRACDYALTTTPVLRQQLSKIIPLDNIHILKNAVDDALINAQKNTIPRAVDDALYLFYGSGSNTHDQDFELLVPALERLFNEYAFLRIMVVGHLSIPQSLSHYQDRFVQVPLLKLDEYLMMLKRADINLAPLVAGVFADCKSEIKWLEAAMLGVPTVMSATDIYQRVIDDQKTGLLVNDPNQWYEHLKNLIDDGVLRQKVAQEARKKALQDYTESTVAKEFLETLKTLQQQQVSRGQLIDQPSDKKSLLFVNVLYPPQAMGGATVVMQNLVEGISKRYADQYEVSVFTSDIENLYSYQLKSYCLNDVLVHALSVPKGGDIDTRFNDPRVKEIFKQYLQYHQPDLINFHCIQHLSASMLEAAIELEIPYVVTVHDAWWISDHQFMIDKNNVLVNDIQNDPLEVIKTSEDPQQSLSRKRYLTSVLKEAKQIFAVSQYQADLYQRNGFDHVLINANGVDVLKDGVALDNHAPQENLVIGYVGGICHHKGFYFLKQTVEALSMANISIKIIDFNASESYEEQWGETDVQFYPKFERHEMNRFYAQIDVLIAPSIWPESFGLVSREAVLRGIWLVVSQAGGLAEVVRHGENGFIFEMSQQQQLTDILNRLDKDYQEYKHTIPPNRRLSGKIASTNEQLDDLLIHFNRLLIE